MTFIMPNPEQTAESHRLADAACGRAWACQCGACRSVRTALADPKASAKPRMLMSADPRTEKEQ